MKSKGIILPLAIIVVIAVLLSLGYISQGHKEIGKKETNASITPTSIVPARASEIKAELAGQKQSVPISWEIGSCGYENRLEIKFTNLKKNETTRARIETNAGKYGVEFLPGEGHIKSGRVPFGTQNGWVESNVEIFANDISVNKTVIKLYCGSGGSSGGSKLQETHSSASTSTPAPTFVAMPIPTSTATLAVPAPTPTPIVDEYCG